MTWFAELEARLGGRPFYLPDLTVWYQWHRGRRSLPQGWEHYSLAEAAHALGAPGWVVHRPWRVETPGIDMTVDESDAERIVTHVTPAGTLRARWSRGPDGDWWQTEYPVKTAGDLRAALDLVSARSYILEPFDSPVQAGGRPQSIPGLGSVAAIELPMRPYSDLLHTLLGWAEGLLLLRGEGWPLIEQMLATLEDKLQGLVRELAPLAADVMLAPDNVDGQYISPKTFRSHLFESYARTAAVLHESGRGLVVHAGGPMRRLLPLLAECGVDCVEGVAGPPQGDATLAEGRALAGPELTLWGGIPQDYLLDGRERDEFEAAVRQATREAREDGHAILGVADRVPAGALLDRLQAIPGLMAGA